MPDDTLLWAVQKSLNLLICHFGCGLWWVEGSTNSIVFARWCHNVPHKREHWHPSAAATRPCVKLLWPLVIFTVSHSSKKLTITVLQCFWHLHGMFCWQLFRRVAAALPGMDQQQKREDSIFAINMPAIEYVWCHDYLCTFCNFLVRNCVTLKKIDCKKHKKQVEHRTINISINCGCKYKIKWTC